MINVPSTLNPTQHAVIEAEQTSFLLGAAGTGKTAALQNRLLHLLQQGEPAYTLLVIVAEPDQAAAYLDAVHQSGLGPYADLKITTYTQMAMEMVQLFWPLVARSAGFERPYHPPTFLSYDLAQLLMWHIITPMLNEGAFADLRLRPQQIVSQLLDTLNRAALNSLSLDEAIERQIRTWAGEPERIRHLNEAATAARNFRATCLRDSLLDLSLAIEVFDTQLVQHPEFHKYFSERYRHLIVDNIEEQTPAGQNFVAELMNETVTTAVAYDAAGGYKRFLAADPLGANKFRSLSAFAFTFDEPFNTNTPLTHLANLVENSLMNTAKPFAEAQQAILGTVNGRYRREMIVELADTLHELMAEHDLHPPKLPSSPLTWTARCATCWATPSARLGCPTTCCAAAPAPAMNPASAPGSPGWRWPIPIGTCPFSFRRGRSPDPQHQRTGCRPGRTADRAPLPARNRPPAAHLRTAGADRKPSGMEFVGLFEEIRLWLTGKTSLPASTSFCTVCSPCSPNAASSRSQTWRGQQCVTGWCRPPPACANRPRRLA